MKIKHMCTSYRGGYPNYWNANLQKHEMLLQNSDSNLVIRSSALLSILLDSEV